MEIKDIRENWDDEMSLINEELKKKMKQNGFGKGQDRYINYQFKEFDIMDMYRDKDGMLCFPCAYGK